MKTVAARLERFRSALDLMLGSPTAKNRAETRVFVFRDEASYMPYKPLRSGGADADARGELAAAVTEGTLSLAELERRYFTLVYWQTGNYRETARRLGCDWRTLRGKIDRDFLRRLGPTESPRGM